MVCPTSYALFICCTWYDFLVCPSRYSNFICTLGMPQSLCCLLMRTSDATPGIPPWFSPLRSALLAPFVGTPFVPPSGKHLGDQIGDSFATPTWRTNWWNLLGGYHWYPPGNHTLRRAQGEPIRCPQRGGPPCETPFGVPPLENTPGEKRGGRLAGDPRWRTPDGRSPGETHM